MEYYELATLTVPVGIISPLRDDLPKAAAAIDAALNADAAGGTPLGSWFSALGPQNEILILRSFETREALFDERQRTLMTGDPFGCGDLLTALKMESFAQFPDLPPIAPADFGPVYEFRSYRLKIGGLAPTLAAWAKAIPARTALSPLVTVMYALDGPPRFTHIWTYPSFETRDRIRAEALRIGVWPAKGAPEWLETEMSSHIYVPTPSSRLT